MINVLPVETVVLKVFLVFHYMFDIIKVPISTCHMTLKTKGRFFGFYVPHIHDLLQMIKEHLVM